MIAPIHGFCLYSHHGYHTIKVDKLMTTGIIQLIISIDAGIHMDSPIHGFCLYSHHGYHTIKVDKN